MKSFGYNENKKEYYCRIFDEYIKLSLIFANEYIIIPAAAVFEIDFFEYLLSNYQQFFDGHFIRFSGKGMDVKEFLERKKEQYFLDRKKYYNYYSPPKFVEKMSYWIEKKMSATEDIAREWEINICDSKSGVLHNILNNPKYINRHLTDKEITYINNNIKESAIVFGFVKRLFPKNTHISKNGKRELINFLNTSWIFSHIKDLKALIIGDFMEPFQGNSILPETAKFISYNKLFRILTQLGIYKIILNLNNNDLVNLKNDINWSPFSKSIIKKTTDNECDWEAFSHLEAQLLNKILKMDLDNNNQYNSILDVAKYYNEAMIKVEENMSKRKYDIKAKNVIINEGDQIGDVTQIIGDENELSGNTNKLTSELISLIKSGISGQNVYEEIKRLSKNIDIYLTEGSLNRIEFENAVNEKLISISDLIKEVNQPSPVKDFINELVINASGTFIGGIICKYFGL